MIAASSHVTQTGAWRRVSGIAVGAVDVTFEAFLPELREPRIVLVGLRTQAEVVLVEVVDLRGVKFHGDAPGDVIFYAFHYIGAHRPAVTVCTHSNDTAESENVCTSYTQLERVSEYAVRAYTTPDSAASYLNYAQIAQTTRASAK